MEKKEERGIEISDWKLACIKLYRPQWQNIHKVPLLQLLITSKLFSLFTVIQAMKIDGRGKSNRGRWGFKGNMNNSSLPRHLVGMHKFNENSIFDKKWKIKQIQFAAKDRRWTLMNNSWTWKVELPQMHLFIQLDFDRKRSNQTCFHMKSFTLVKNPSSSKNKKLSCNYSLHCEFKNKTLVKNLSNSFHQVILS